MHSLPFQIPAHIPYCGAAIEGVIDLLRAHGSIAGCQALRKQIGHILFGMRVVYGEPIFMTLSPNRRHSSLILKLSRTRRNDVGITGDDDISRQKTKFCGADKPSIFVPGFCTSGEDVETVFAIFDFPCLKKVDRV